MRKIFLRSLTEKLREYHQRLLFFECLRFSSVCDNTNPICHKHVEMFWPLQFSQPEGRLHFWNSTPEEPRFGVHENYQDFHPDGKLFQPYPQMRNSDAP